MPSVLLVDDHPCIITLLRQMLEEQGLQVVGEAATAADAVRLSAECRPDVVVLDLHLLDGSSLPVISQICGRVLVFSGDRRAGAVKQALAAGAHGYVEKHTDVSELAAGIRAVARGDTYFTPHAEAGLRGPSPPRMRLSARDRAVLRGVAEGLSSKLISHRLGCSPHVVNNIRARLMKRANLRGVAQLARYAVSLGLLPDHIEGAPETE